MENSEFYMKRTTGYCREYLAMRHDLLAGRNCNSSAQCVTMNCRDGKCVGGSDQASCHSHADCGNKQYCNELTVFPFLSTCKAMFTAYQPCGNDYECEPNLYCWYPNKEGAPDNNIGQEENIVKQCLPKYTQQKGKAFGWGWTQDVTDLDAA